MDGLTPEQLALLASINSANAAAAPSPVFTPPVEATPVPDANSNRVLSQAEIDALFASMT